MNTDESLAVLLKLVNGNKEQCLKLVETVRSAYPSQSMQWCIQKAIYDLRFGKSSLSPAAKTKPISKPLPPPPPPNPELSKPKSKSWGAKGLVISSSVAEKPIALSPQDLQALLKAKQKMASSPPSSDASRRKLYQLLRGDVEQARRLVQRLRIANPDRTEQWAVDKAIYDLERDRI